MITFKDFLSEDLTGKYGEYLNDTSEKTMIHWIINYCIGAGGKSEKNYDIAYSFLESDLGGKLHDKYYEVFGQLNPDFTGPKRRNELNQFVKDSRSWFKKWKKTKDLNEGLASMKTAESFENLLNTKLKRLGFRHDHEVRAEGTRWVSGSNVIETIVDLEGETVEWKVGTRKGRRDSWDKTDTADLNATRSVIDSIIKFAENAK